MRFAAAAFTVCILWSSSVSAQTETSASRAKATEKIIIDTDIGNDIDDAFAVGLALHSPEFQVLGISSAWGDTHLRARLLSRLPLARKRIWAARLTATRLHSES